MTLLTALVAAAWIGLVAVDDAGRVAWVNVAFLIWAGQPALSDPTGGDFAERFPTLADQAPGQAPGRYLPSSSRLHWVPALGQGWVGQIALAANWTQAPLTDELTGLGGRPELRGVFAETVESGAVGRSEVAYLALDLDRFKEVNDAFGHPVRDELLRRVASRITHLVEPHQGVFRLGGDEFGILLSCSKVEEVALALAERIINVLSRSFVIHGQEVEVGASIGIARVCPSALSIDAAYRDADLALYTSKNSGRGQASLFKPELARTLEERRVIERDLKRAILLDQLELRYQPEHNPQAGTVSGCQALIHWRHPERGMILPAVFIPVAEKTLFITEIGRWALREACRTAVTWPLGLSVTINVSSAQFTDTHFLAMVFLALQESGLAPRRLILEVTSSILLADKELVEATIVVLHNAGVKVSLDGVGTGCSSPGLLSRSPLDDLKADRDAGSASANEHGAVTSTVGLGMPLMAEGTETSGPLDAACLQGCHVGRGIPISHPLPKDAMASHLRTLAPTLPQRQPGAAWLMHPSGATT